MTSTGRSVGGPATDVVAYALVIAAAVAWGTVGVAGRLADDAGIGPVSATAGRTVVAAVALLPLVAGTGVPPLPARSGARWGVVAVGQLLALYQISYFAAVRHVGVTVAFVAGGAVLPRLFGRDAVAVTLAGAGWLVYIGLVPTVLAYGLFFTGVARVPAPRAALTLLLEPVTAAVLAAVLLGERLAPSGLLGGALVLVAVAIVARSPRGVGRTTA